MCTVSYVRSTCRFPGRWKAHNVHDLIYTKRVQVSSVESVTYIPVMDQNLVTAYFGDAEYLDSDSSELCTYTDLARRLVTIVCIYRIQMI